MNNTLTPSSLSPALNTKWIGHTYQYYPQIDSTNEELKRQLAQKDAQSVPAGMVILTNYQTHGKGRLNRQWEASASTSLLFSILFRPQWEAERANWMTMMASLAVVEAIEAATKLTVGIKWPNDIVVQRDAVWHKVCGLLLEGDVDANGRLQSIILGIGLNVNIPAPKLPQAVTPPTSLLVATGQPVPRRPLFVDILQRIEQYYETAVNGHSPHVNWNGRLITLNQKVSATNIHNNQTIHGLAIGTTPNGELLIRDQNNKEHTIIAGDITMRQ